MTNEEVGQYILLLSEAWLSNKDASLPDVPEVLARKARCRKVSDKVLAMFPVVQTPWGSRRQNETLYAEWRSTLERLDLAKEYGRRGGEAKKASSRDALGSLQEPSRVPLPITKPDQTDSSQTNPVSETDSQNERGQGTFKHIAIQYSSFFGIHHSKGKKHLERYYTACQKYGEDMVLEYFKRWAQTAGWLKEKRDTNGLNFFWRPLEEMIEGDQIRIARETEQKKEEVPGIEKIMEADLAERQKQILSEQEEIRKQQEFEEATRDQI